MKTVVSIPDDIFEDAERLAKKLGKPRSTLYAQAIAEYLARHEDDAVTEAMNAVCDAIDPGGEKFVAEAARRTLRRAEW